MPEISRLFSYFSLIKGSGSPHLTWQLQHLPTSDRLSGYGSGAGMGPHVMHETPNHDMHTPPFKSHNTPSHASKYSLS